MKEGSHCRSRDFNLQAQPTETSCGPTCLQAVYHQHGLDYNLEQLIDEIPQNEDGGTLSVQLALHALAHQFEATIYSYNIRVFDPTWRDLQAQEIAGKLGLRLKRTRKEKARSNLQAYIQYVHAGGKLCFDELSPALLKTLLNARHPILTGLSATHLYRNARSNRDNQDDDIYGEPDGHFVLLLEYLADKRQVVIADPYRKNPFCEDLIYTVSVYRLINAIMLGIITYDANMLILKPKSFERNCETK